MYEELKFRRSFNTYTKICPMVFFSKIEKCEEKLSR